MPLKLCIAGATGHVGQELVRTIQQRPEFSLTACIGKTTAGKRLQEVVNAASPNLLISASVSEALSTAPFGILIDYTTPKAVFQTVLTSIEHRVHCIIGTSGLTDEQYIQIHQRALENKVGVFAAGNFSLTAALMLHFSRIAAHYVPHWEVFDYASDTKVDAPSGTSRELAFVLREVNNPKHTTKTKDIHGMEETRGGNVNGTQVHSIRLPGFYSSSEVIFGQSGERLSLRHDSMSYAPYVEGTLLAATKVSSFIGLRRGMNELLGFN